MALSPASQPPTRFMDGVQTDAPFGPLANSGRLNPFFYQEVADDFPYINSSLWTGTLTAVPGDGGIVSTSGPMQSPAVFTLPVTGNNPPTTAQSAKKMFFLCRMQLMTSASTQAFIAGFCNSGVTGVTATDGLFFSKPAGGTTLQVMNVASAANSPSGVAVSKTWTVQAAASTPAIVAGQTFDLGLEWDRNQNVFGFCGVRLVGFTPQSGSGGVGVGGTPLIPTRGRIWANYNWLAQQTGMFGNVATPVMYTTAPLCLTVSVSGGAAQVDFICGQKER